jgi:hypothetical protein
VEAERSSEKSLSFCRTPYLCNELSLWHRIFLKSLKMFLDFKIHHNAHESPTLDEFLEKYTELCSYLLTMVPRSRIFLSLRWRRYVPPKRQFTQDLHGATSQKTALLIFYLYLGNTNVHYSLQNIPAYPGPVQSLKSDVLRVSGRVTNGMAFIPNLRKRSILFSIY